MISLLFYAHAVGAMLAIAAIAAERAIRGTRVPRRAVWLAAMLATTVLPILALVDPRPPALAAEGVSQSTDAPRTASSEIAGRIYASRLQVIDRQDEASSRVAFLKAWGVASGTLALFWIAAAAGLWRRSRHWSTATVAGTRVWVSQEEGPAVYGGVSPRILLPASMLRDTAVDTLALVIRHEEAHLRARDPLLILSALALATLVPWNATIWWQLRRLRYAVELDCDARVLAAGVEPRTYADTLITIASGRFARRAPAWVALNEPRSWLEKRIRTMLHLEPRPKAIALAGLIGAFAVAVALTTLLPPPSLAAAEIRKPAPDQGPLPWYIGALESLIHERYPHLLTEKQDQTPVLLVLFRDDRSVEATALTKVAVPASDYQPTSADFAAIGLRPDEVGIIVANGIGSKANTMLAVMTQRKSSSAPGTWSLAPDTREIDRRLAQQYFSDTLERGAVAGERIWVLFSHDGRPLQSGRDRFEDGGVRKLLETRFPDIRISGSTATPVTRADGKPVLNPDGSVLELNSVWLAKDSALPR